MIFIASAQLTVAGSRMKMACAPSKKLSTTAKSMARVSRSAQNLLFYKMTVSSRWAQNRQKLPSAICPVRSHGYCCHPAFHFRHVYSQRSTGQRPHYSSSPMPLSMASSLSHNKWEHITNHQTSKTVKLFKSIHRANKAKRSELGLTIAEGVRLVSDILANEDSRQLVRRIVISESLLYSDTDQYQKQLLSWLQVVDEESRLRKAEYDNRGTEMASIPTCSINIGTDKVVEACSGTVTSQGVVAMLEMPEPYNPLGSDSPVDVKIDKEMPRFYLILDGLQDPGNVGTLLRTCAASHATALILLPGSCDVWNPKAVRAAMGASFRVPVLEISKDGKNSSLNQVLDLLDGCGVDNERVYAATMDAPEGGPSLPHYDIDFANEGGVAVILGREGEGLRSEVRDAINRRAISTVHVPMAPGVESLNAAVCGSVIMFERMRQILTTKEED